MALDWTLASLHHLAIFALAAAGMARGFGM